MESSKRKQILGMSSLISGAMDPYLEVMEYAQIPPFNEIKMFPEKGKLRGKVVGVRTTPKTHRNEPCHCGSGLKYKKCCLLNDKQK